MTAKLRKDIRKTLSDARIHLNSGYLPRVYPYFIFLISLSRKMSSKRDFKLREEFLEEVQLGIASLESENPRTVEYRIENLERIIG